ncbi:hypothetical protein ACFE04_029381 [Oxalis oulophora]
MKNGVFGGLRVSSHWKLSRSITDDGNLCLFICLRWLYEQGVIVLVKSFNKKRIEENVDIFDWKLSPDDSQKITQIPQQRVCTGEYFIYQHGPFKTLEDLWDGDL